MVNFKAHTLFLPSFLFSSKKCKEWIHSRQVSAHPSISAMASCIPTVWVDKLALHYHIDSLSTTESKLRKNKEKKKKKRDGKEYRIFTVQHSTQSDCNARVWNEAKWNGDYYSLWQGFEKGADKQICTPDQMKEIITWLSWSQKYLRWSSNL